MRPIEASPASRPSTLGGKNRYSRSSLSLTGMPATFPTSGSGMGAPGTRPGFDPATISRRTRDGWISATA